jgi:hypothetical protein
MDPARSAAVAIVLGVAFIALGLFPSLLAQMKAEIRQFGDSRSLTTRSRQNARDDDERLLARIWWAVGGLALLVLGLLAFIK